MGPETLYEGLSDGKDTSEGSQRVLVCADSRQPLPGHFDAEDGHGAGNIFIHPADCMPNLWVFPGGLEGRESTCQCRRRGLDPWVGKSRWRRKWQPTPGFLGFLCGSAGKESACNTGDLGSILGSGRSPGGGSGNPFQDSCLENPTD